MSSNEPNATTAGEAGSEIWRVQLMTGEVRAMSLDALDDAFQSGLVTESTPVLAPGATAWTKLADAAGLDAPPAEPTVPSVAPLAVSIVDSTGDATPYARSGPLSDEALMHLAADDEAAFKPKRGRLFAGIGVAVVLAVGVGIGASRMSGLDVSARSSLSAQAAEKAAAAAPPPAAVDLGQAAPAKTLTEEQRAKLAEADKAREAAAAAKEAQRRKDRPTPPARRGPREKSSQPFQNGGNKFDPLNGAL